MTTSGENGGALRRPTLMLLPGMDGTGRLFGRFDAALGGACPTIPVTYSETDRQSYDTLCETVGQQLQRVDGPVVLVAESFSGPIAMRIAANAPQNLVGVALVATFASSPKPRWLRFLAGRAAFALPIPKMAVRAFLLGRSADDSLVDEVRDAVGRVRPEVMAYRAREILGLQPGDTALPNHVPYLFIAATRDRLVRPNRNQLERLLPGLQWAEVDGPHLVLQAAPQQTAAVITRFIDRIGEPEVVGNSAAHPS